MSTAVASRSATSGQRRRSQPAGQRLLTVADNGGLLEPSLSAVSAERPIGYGAFGAVWSTTDPRNGRPLAVKKMPRVLQSLVSAKRAHRELHLLHRLQHDNIVSLVCVLEEPNFPQEICLVCELMQTDLHKIIVSQQPITIDHVKIFLYQTLRGLKYLHSANILHRDMKPGNLLVNSDCQLRICDFGLARVNDPQSKLPRSLTLEVVTQYYRAPELLMGAIDYSAAIDIWSVGCIFAELLSRSILFQAGSPLSQLDLILDLLGTPDPTDLTLACSAARRHVLRQPTRRPRLAAALWSVSHTVTEDGLHLLEHMLRFNPQHRATAVAALNHPYLAEARVRYHACMCTCCSRHHHQHQHRHSGQHFEPEPICQMAVSDAADVAIVDHESARRHLRVLLHSINSCQWQQQQQQQQQQLRLNYSGDNYREFARSSVAASSELPPSPHRW